MRLDSPATLSGVPTHAGVSVASASRVLNGLPSSPSMIEKVQASAAALGYRPNAFARSLKVQRTDQLAFAMSDVGNPVYVTMMRAVEEATRDEGYRLMISSIASDPAAVVELMRSLRHSYADGLVLSPSGMDDTELATVTTPTLTSVSLGSYRRGHLAAELLLERLREPQRPVRRVTVQPELHARASTALLQVRS